MILCSIKRPTNCSGTPDAPLIDPKIQPFADDFVCFIPLCFSEIDVIPEFLK
jgi:hypothetical protein